MKILIVSPHYYPEPFSVTIIAESLVKKGHEVAVVTGHPYIAVNEETKNEYKNKKYEIINGVEVYRVKHSYKKDSVSSIYRCYLSYWKSCNRFLSYFEENFDIVLSFCLSPIIASSGANLYSRYHNVKHVHYCYDLWPESAVATGHIAKNSLQYKILHKWSKGIYKSCSHIIVTSPSFTKYLHDEFDLRDTPITTIHQPINFAEPLDHPSFNPKKFHVVYAGNISKLQLVDLLINSAKNLDENKFQIHLVGNGSYLSEVKRIITENNLDKIVEVCGPKPPDILSGYLECADALFVGLKNDTFVGNTIPNKISHYLHAKKPIIASISGDGKMLLEDAGGTIFCKENSEDISHAILELEKMSKKELEKMGESNFEYCTKNLDNSAIINQIENLLEKTIN